MTDQPDSPDNGNDSQFGPDGRTAINDQRDAEQIAVLDEDRLTADTTPLDDGEKPRE